MTDKRFGSQLARNRMLLYVPTNKKVVLEQFLKLMPTSRAPSLSSAIFLALEDWIAAHKKEEA